LEQTDFTKIVLLDLDMVVAHSIDEVFMATAPAALFRGNTNSRAGSQRSGATLFSKKTGEQQGGINAGVMVLEPSREDFKQMAGELGRTGVCTSAPEQDYLSQCGLYADKWTKLPVKYNYQPHQLRYLERRGITDCERKMRMEEVSIFHYSGEVSPRDYLFEAFAQGWTDEGDLDFTHFNEELCKKWGQKQVNEEDHQRMKECVENWHTAFQRMWKVVLKTVVGTERDCPVCGEENACEPEHVFLQCRPLDSQRKEWKQDIRYTKTFLNGQSRSQSEMLFYPHLFPATLHYVAQVEGFRHPKGSALDYASFETGKSSAFGVIQALRGPAVPPAREAKNREEYALGHRAQRRERGGKGRPRGGKDDGKDIEKDRRQLKRQLDERDRSRLEDQNPKGSGKRRRGSVAEAFAAEEPKEIFVPSCAPPRTGPRSGQPTPPRGPPPRHMMEGQRLEPAKGAYGPPPAKGLMQAPSRPPIGKQHATQSSNQGHQMIRPRWGRH
jgi:lipopolysaccharide biosynthesis glycosyltransferase